MNFIYLVLLFQDADPLPFSSSRRRTALEGFKGMAWTGRINQDQISCPFKDNTRYEP